MLNQPVPFKMRSYTSLALNFFWLILGSFLAALSIKIFLLPNDIYDGGFLGISMLCSFLLGDDNYMPYFLIAFNTPFMLLAYKELGKTFVLQMFFAIFAFWGMCAMIEYLDWQPFEGDPIEIIVAGGLILGIGIGLIIRKGASLDGAEILSIIINHRQGIPVGQIYLFFNIFVFLAAGQVYQEIHVPLRSLMMFMVASKVMDGVIVGLEETKSVKIISSKSKQVADAIMKELSLGLTILYGRGGFSGQDREILYVVIERLQLAELKDVIYREDPLAFIAIENLHEVVNGRVESPTHNQPSVLQHVYKKPKRQASKTAT